jgi:lysophospholipase L1-like esterase
MTNFFLRRKLLYLLYLFVVVFILLEIALRIFNPLHFRIRGNKILLPVSQKQIIRNDINPKLDSVVVNTRNAIGFRGPERPANWDEHLTIVSVGGSTTECHFLSDDKTWTWLLGKKLEDSLDNVWMNNAGFDGHSTFGHQVLLNDYLVKLRPKIVLFMTGINDVENDQPSFFDELNRKGGYADFRHFIVNNSEVLNTVWNLLRGWRAQKMNNTTSGMLDLRKGTSMVMSEEQINERKRKQQKYLAGYKIRLEQIIDTCKRYNMRPVFITQASQLGYGRDPVTGVDLATLKLGDDMNGKCFEDVLQLYNDQMKEVCKAKNVAVIDLAKLLPKNSLYFYDRTHFTNAGAQKVAEIIAPRLTAIIRSSDF